MPPSEVTNSRDEIWVFWRNAMRLRYPYGQAYRLLGAACAG